MNERHTITTLSKVQLTLEAGTSPEHMELTPTPIPLDFIVGVAPDGLSGLEMAILEKKVPDEIVVEVKPSEIAEFFGHLPSPGLIFSTRQEPFYVTLGLTAAEPADNREVIRSMAAATQCGCSCGCDQH